MSGREADDAVCAAILAADTHYEVLQVDPSIRDGSQIRKNYIRISVKVHPDRNRSADATKAFQRVSEAYEVLVDEAKRRDYDQGRTTSQQAKPAPAFSFDDALRVFRMAVGAAEAAAAVAGAKGGGLEDALRVATALLALRETGTLGETARVAAGLAAGASAVASMLPDSWQESIKKHITPENTLRAVAAASLVAGAIMSARENDRRTP